MLRGQRAQRLRARTVWISDVHLGFRGCSAELLLDFLRQLECERLYLVGDIVDVWSMKRRPYWPQSHNNVVRIVLGVAKHGTKVPFVPGNHDAVLRSYGAMRFGNVTIEHEVVHEGADGRRYLVLHGDKFDSVVRCSKALAVIGSQLYDALLTMNVWVNPVRRILGRTHWSLSAYLKYCVKNALQYISNSEAVVAYEAHRQGLDGVICGHIHHAEVRIAVPARHEAGHRRWTGPLKLEQQYPRAAFVSMRHGNDLAAHLGAGDVFVFPSKTDTFGIVLLEAMACGLPVAAYPVTGPVDVVQQGVTGVLDEDLGRAVREALDLDSARCVAYAGRFSWRAATETFSALLATRRGLQHESAGL